MLSEFGQILTFIILAIVFVIAGILTAKVLSPKNPTKEKLTTYECGENPVGSPWVKFNIRFYVIALVFIIFDLEVVFLFPWAVVFKDMGMIAFLEMFVFLVILGLGFVYLWARGDLEWIRPEPEIPALKRTIIKKEDVPAEVN
ncbi:MAG: NADH-quinone oxidoreductase subunit A [Ignavibacteriae bacterium]|nr:MAG: NADH-quinone oxidoreductase subunit A [Ignavibacteriota bacterium]